LCSPQAILRGRTLSAGVTRQIIFYLTANRSAMLPL
jgi:hypothetical protein